VKKASISFGVKESKVLLSYLIAVYFSFFDFLFRIIILTFFKADLKLTFSRLAWLDQQF